MPCLKMLSPAPPQSSDPSLATPEMGWPLLLTPDLGIHVNMALPAMLCLRMLRAIMHPRMYIQESSKFKMKDGRSWEIQAVPRAKTAEIAKN